MEKKRQGRSGDVVTGETAEFIGVVCKVIESFENANVKVDTFLIGEIGAKYDASIEVNQKVFKVTAFANSKKAFFEAKDNIAEYTCDAIIVTKNSPADDLKNEVKGYNLSDKKHKIHLISGDTEEKLKKEFAEIL